MLKELRPGGRGGSLRDAETNKITGAWQMDAHLRSSCTPLTRSTRSQRSRVHDNLAVDSGDDGGEEVSPAAVEDDARGTIAIDGFRLIHTGQLRAFIDDNFCCRGTAADEFDDFVAFVSESNPRQANTMRNQLRKFRRQKHRSCVTITGEQHKPHCGALASASTFSCGKYNMTLETSPTVVNPATNRKVSEVNVRMVQGMINIGRGMVSMYILAAHLGMPLGNSWFNKTVWRRYENMIGGIIDVLAASCSFGPVG